MFGLGSVRRMAAHQLHLVVGILLLIIPNVPAFAGDYTLVYALEIGDQIETGRSEGCEFTRQCVIKSKLFGISVSTGFIYPENRDVYVSVYGRKGCCFFTDGRDSISFDSRRPIPPMAIFEGHARRGNELVQNYRMGTLYIKLSPR